MFKYKAGNGLYLSSYNTFNTTEFVNLYTDVRLISAAYPGFYGIPVDKYKVINNSELSLKLPTYLNAGNYDVIYCNPAGYFKMSDRLKDIPLIITNDI